MVRPRFPLAILPTPLVDAPRLSRELGGPHILFKRDDLTGFGFGGNKVRGLELYMADALALAADVVVTGAGPQSNHIRATAAAARVAGLDVVAVMHDSRPPVPEGNLLLDEILGVTLHFTESPDRSLVDVRIEEVAADLKRDGRRPYVIPRGGTAPLGSLGYVLCVSEMMEQFDRMSLRPTWVVVTTGACGTHAGLLAGMKIEGAAFRVLGITVSRPVSECLTRIRSIAVETAKLAGHAIELGEDDVLVRDGFIGPGYGITTPEGVEAIRLVARTEGLFFDPVYTGKAMAGLAAEIREGRLTHADTVVFIHTGGEPGLFAHPEVASPA